MTSRATAGRGTPRTAERGGDRNAWLWPALGCGLVALLLFLPTLPYGFVRDDRDLFADNPFMKNPGYLGKILKSDYWGSTLAQSGLWRPLVSLSFWTEGRLFGWMPGGFHAVNVVSHALVTALVAGLATVLGSGAAVAWIAGLWFALAPAHVEPVAWISGRTDLWCALFGLAALAAHEKSARGGWPWRVAAVLGFGLALLSKEAAAPIFLVLAAMVWRRRSSGPAPLAATLRELAPYAVLGLAWAVAHVNIAPGAMASTPGWPSPTGAERAWTALALFPSQLMFLLPALPGFGHGPDWWIEPARSASDPRVALGLLLHVGALVLVLRGLRARSGITPALLLLWLPSLLMASVILSRGVLLQGERNVYLPSAGAAWLLGIAGRALYRRGLAPTTLPRVVLPVLYVGLLIFNVERAIAQIPGWRSDATMYSAMVRAQPGRADGYLGVALVAIGNQRDKTALGALAHAEVIDSTRYEVATYRAAIASRHQLWSEVIHWSRMAIRRGSKESDPWLMLANAYQSMNDWRAARPVVDTLRARFKTDPDAAAAYGRQMVGEGTPKLGIEALQYAVGWSPSDPALRMLLGDALMRDEQLEPAIDQFRRAAALQPNNADVWKRLALLYHYRLEPGLRDDAIRAAASLPGADTTALRRFYNQLLTGPSPEPR